LTTAPAAGASISDWTLDNAGRGSRDFFEESLTPTTTEGTLTAEGAGATIRDLFGEVPTATAGACLRDLTLEKVGTATKDFLGLALTALGLTATIGTGTISKTFAFFGRATLTFGLELDLLANGIPLARPRTVEATMRVAAIIARWARAAWRTLGREADFTAKGMRLARTGESNNAARSETADVATSAKRERRTGSRHALLQVKPAADLGTVQTATLGLAAVPHANLTGMGSLDTPDVNTQPGNSGERVFGERGKGEEEEAEGGETDALPSG
jgi:hypothetical protein